MMNKPVIVIVGPTACGKSNLALALAEKFDSEIINADSLQVYKGLELLTASPSKADIERVSHHLYNVLDPVSQRSTLGWWFDEATKHIQNILSQGKLPIVVGGTGLYINGLVNGITPIPDIPKSIRMIVQEEFNNWGRDVFWDKLTKLDPKSAAILRKTDTQRIKRAYEVKLSTGKSIVDWWNSEPIHHPYDFIVFYINKDRNYLFEQCNKRFLKMIEEGAIQEVIAFRGKYASSTMPINNAIGLNEIELYLDGKQSLGDVINLAQIRTKHYAKRQITWFKNKLNPDYTIGINNNDKIYEFISKILDHRLKPQSMSNAVL